MPDLLGVIWERADAREPRFSGDEVGALAEGHVGRLVHIGLMREVESTPFVTCDACADGHTEEVQFVESPRGSALRAYICCPEHGRVRVPLDRLRQWEVDFGGIAGAIARALELAGDVDEVVSERVWSLGKATIAAQSREVFLARGLTWEDARDVLGKTARLNAAKSAIVLAAGDVPPNSIWSGDAPPIVALKTVVAWRETGLSVDREHLESLLSTGRKKTPAVRLVSFPTPAGTTWADVRLVVRDRHLQVEAKGKRKEYSFQEAGFEERRKKNMPDRLWELLKTFAMHGGVLPFKALRHCTNLKQYISDLRRRLAALLPGIEGESIAYDKDGKSYTTAFRISSEEGVQFPTPPSASWADVSIISQGEFGVCVSVTASERFSTSGYSEDKKDGAPVHRWEMAERDGVVKRTYDFRMLRLADGQGRPNPAGEALLAVLSGQGRIKRKDGDKGMLNLCGILTKLMAISGSPFRFAAREEEWVALFDAGG